MAIVIGEVVANIAGDSKGFDQALDNVKKSGEKAITGIEQRFTKLSNDITKKGKALSKSITAPILAIGTAFFAASNRAANLADEIDKMSIRSGISRESLQELRFVTDQVGVEFGSVERAVDSFRRRLLQADEGSGRTADILQGLGVEVRGVDGEFRDMNTLFPEIVAGLSRVENETERGALAMQIFGRSASDLAPLLAQGEAGIEKLTARAHELGLVMGDEAIADLVDFKDMMAEVKEQAFAVGREFGMVLVPIIKNELIPLIQDRLIPAVRNVVDFFNSLEDGTKRNALVIAGLAASAGPIMMAVGALSKLAIAIRAVTLAMLANPYLALAAGLLLLTTRIVQLNAESNRYKRTLNELNHGTDEQKRKVDELVASTEKLTKAERERVIFEQIDEIRDYISTLREQRDALREEEEAKRRGVQTANSAMSAHAGLSAAIQVETNATKDLSDAIKDKNEKIAEAHGMIKQLEKAVIDLSTSSDDASVDVDVDVEGATHDIAEFRAELDEMINAWRDSNKEVEAFNTNISHIPPNVLNEAFPPGSIGAIRNEIAELNEQMQFLVDPMQIQGLMDKIAELEVQLQKMTGFKRLSEHLLELEKFAIEATQALSKGLADSLAFGRDLKQTLDQIIRQLASKALQSLIMLALTGGTTGADGFIGGLFGSFKRVGDAMIKSNGDVVQFHPNDNIMAFQGNNIPTSAQKVHITMPVTLDGRVIWEANRDFEVNLP